MSAPSSPPPRIVITGFMGAGKTTVARALAAHLQCAMSDTDEAVIEREGRSIEAIIGEVGEAQFRRIEAAALRRVLEFAGAGVIALGGGAWMMAENRALIAAHGCLTIWLDAPFELCRQRIAQGGQARPFARDYEAARHLYERRREVYALASRRVEIAAGESVERIVARLAALVEQASMKSNEREGRK